ncbi:AraC family transcriptional regulator [Flavicella marina]|uniref:AraC family transcriptional regulator n=1 Tax=Flavicella marina TaxID=1475951 RepID=UPI0012659EC4|nr:AraC family transcriptional regulator [Flavicella marina]
MPPIKIHNKIESENFFKIAEFKKDIRKTKPHKHHKYIEIVFFKEGSGTHTIDNNEIEIAPFIVNIIRKEQVHFWDLQSEPSGYVILLKKDFIENALDKELKRLLFDLSKYPYFFPKDTETVCALFAMLLKEYNANEADNDVVLEGLFKVLLAKLLQSETRKENTRESLYHKFVDLLTSYKITSSKVEDYAVLLNTTPQNLNTICKKESNVSASTLLSEFIISEAKRLLWYSNLSIQEIAYTLPFKDNSHFSKFFKRSVGVTPKIFRMNQQSVPQ